MAVGMPYHGVKILANKGRKTTQKTKITAEL